MIRAGQSRAVIQIVAELQGGADEAEEFVLTREISASGKSLAKINGEIVTLAQLSEPAARLADIHGQYDRHSLFKTENHLALIDAYHSRVTGPARKAVAAAFRAYAEAKRELSALLQTEASSARRRDFMRFELDEITKADPKPGEDAALREELAVLQNRERIYERTATASEALCDGERAAVDGLGAAMRALQDVSAYSKDLKRIAQTVADAYYALEDAAGALRALRDRMDFSPETLNGLIARLDAIERLCGKYGGSLDKVLAYKETLRAALADIEDPGARKAALAERTRAREDELVRACESLRALRKASAAELETKINAELAELHFSKAVFAARFDDAGDIRQKLSENGADSVEFLISSNRGQPLLPLAKIASGGEMSRILLAFKAVIGDYDGIPTMIFDEIDSGISGITAGVVGRKLVKMAEKRQIICITHLPQIAACGDSHFAIRKSDDGESTRTFVEALDGEARVLEIARLIGGARITETTLKSARELIEMSAAAGP
jgi:DNA repair protein RecN (Recombination protein N)